MSILGSARLLFEVDGVGNVIRGNREVEQSFNTTARSAVGELGKMDSAHLRVVQSSRRYQDAVRRSGSESHQAVNALIRLRTAEERVAAQSTRTGRSMSEAGHGFHVLGRDVERAAVGATLGSKAFHGLRQSILLGGSGLLGGFGASYALRTVLSAAKDAQVSQAQLQGALANTGNSWVKYGAQVTGAVNAQVRATGFTNDELTSSLAAFVNRFGDVNQALRANGIAADVARRKNEDLATAQQQILRASFGNPRAAKQLGVEVAKVTTNFDQLKATTQHATAGQVAFAKAADQAATQTATLDAIQQHYHGSAARYLTTSAGKQALFNAELRHSEEIIGTALLPTFNRLLGRLGSYLDRMNRTGRLQRDVNVVAKDGTIIVRDLSKAVGFLNRNLGGATHTVEAFGAALIGLKLGGIITRLGALSGSGGLRGVSAAAGESGAAGKVALLGTRLGQAGLVAEAGAASFAITTLVLKLTGLDKTFKHVGGSAYDFSQTLGLVSGAPTNYQGGQGNPLAKEVKHGQMITPDRVAALRAEHPELADHDFQVLLAAALNPTAPGSGGAAGRRRNYRPGAGTRGRSGPGIGGNNPPPGDPTSIPVGIQQQLAAAGLTPKDQADDRAAYAAEAAFIRKQLAAAKLTALQRLALTQQLGSDIQAIQSIDDQAAQAVQDAARKAAERRAAARRKAEAAARRATQIYRAGVARTRTGLENDVTEAQTAEQRSRTPQALSRAQRREREALQAEVRFYDREAKDTRLSSSQRDTASRSAANARKQLATLAARDAKQGQTLQASMLSIRLSLAETAVANASKGTDAYNRAVEAEKRVLNAEIRLYDTQAHNRTVALSARAAAAARETTAAKRLAGLNKQQVGTGVQAQAFLRDLTGIARQYASDSTGPNKPRGTGSTPVTVVQNINHPVSQFALMRAAREAAQHVML